MDETAHSLASTRAKTRASCPNTRGSHGTRSPRHALFASSSINARLSALQANCIFGPFRKRVSCSQRDSTTPCWTRQPKRFESVRHLLRCHYHCSRSTWYVSSTYYCIDCLLLDCFVSLALFKLQFVAFGIVGELFLDFF